MSPIILCACRRHPNATPLPVCQHCYAAAPRRLREDFQLATRSDNYRAINRAARELRRHVAAVFRKRNSRTAAPKHLSA